MSLLDIDPIDVLLDAKNKIKDINSLKDNLEKVLGELAPKDNSSIGDFKKTFTRLCYPANRLISDEIVKSEMKMMLQIFYRFGRFGEILDIMKISKDYTNFTNSLIERTRSGFEPTEGQLNTIVEILINETN